MIIGVAVGIPEPYARELSRARHLVGDPMADTIPPHVTLLPPTEVEDGELASIRAHLAAAAAASSPFTLRLAGTRTFRPLSPVVYVALEQGWEECRELQSCVNSGVLATELQFPYHPHVTIAHDVSEEALNEAETAMDEYHAEFTISNFKLYEFTSDEVWQVLETFALNGGGPAEN